MTPAEKAVIGGILDGGEQFIPELGLKPENFSTVFGETVYRLILGISESGQTVDRLSLSGAVSLLDEAGKRIITPADVWTLPEGMRGSVTYYAEIVLEEASRRSLAGHAARVNQLVQESAPVATIIEEAERALRGIADGTGSTIEAVGETIDETLDELDSPVTFVETPWENVNHFIQGWRPGGFYIIAARPSVGKTVAGLQAALSLCNKGAVAFTSLEMSSNELQLRMVSYEARVDMNRITRRQLSNRDWESVVKARARWKELPLFIDPSRDGSMAQVVRHANSVKRSHGLTAIVIDYLQLLEPAVRGMREYEAVTDNSRRLRLLAKSLNVPVICLAQLNRGSEHREGKRPQSSDIRGSGAVEQDADVVMLLHRDLVNTPHEAEFIVAKNRHGIGGVADLEFAGHYSMLRDTVRGYVAAA